MSSLIHSPHSVYLLPPHFYLLPPDKTGRPPLTRPPLWPKCSVPLTLLTPRHRAALLATAPCLRPQRPALKVAQLAAANQTSPPWSTWAMCLKWCPRPTIQPMSLWPRPQIVLSTHSRISPAPRVAIWGLKAPPRTHRRPKMSMTTVTSTPLKGQCIRVPRIWQ